MSESDLDAASGKETLSSYLRNIDLNLLTVFDAVMQEQSITRAASLLGISQPAVSNAVVRLKAMFNDELFIRFGRGIQPTARAKQLFSPVRQALLLVRNELPGTEFDAQTSERTFSISICSPLDLRLAVNIINTVKGLAPHIRLQIRSFMNSDIEQQLRYRETDFVISYKRFDGAEFCSEVLFEDELVLVASQTHPRISKVIMHAHLLAEEHAVVSLENFCSFSKPYYIDHEMRNRVAQQCTDLLSVLDIVAKTQLIAIVPKWLAQQRQELLSLKIISLPGSKQKNYGYLSWHESASSDKSYLWMKTLLNHMEVL